MPARVLIVKFGAIGDVVMALPAVRALHEQGAAIDWVCGSAVAPLLACYPWIRTVVADDRALLTGSIPGRVAAMTKLWRRLGVARYDLCATLYYDARYGLLTLPVRAGRRLMLSRTERTRRLNSGRAHADEIARILLGEEDGCRAWSRPPVRPDEVPGSPLPAKQRGVRVGLVPGGASNMLRQQTLRRWPAAAYVRLAAALLARGDEVVLLGGADDAWVRAEFGAAPGAEVQGEGLLDAIGRLSLPQVIAACDSCDLVISHDTGPLHLAGLSRAAVLGLFGPTDPANFLPRREGVRGIWGGEGFACRPCYDGATFAPCRDNGCMQQITVEMVLAQADRMLAERRPASASGTLVVLPSAALGVER